MVKGHSQEDFCKVYREHFRMRQKALRKCLQHDEIDEMPDVSVYIERRFQITGNLLMN
jgi:hypothetical protein